MAGIYYIGKQGSPIGGGVDIFETAGFVHLHNYGAYRMKAKTHFAPAAGEEMLEARERAAVVDGAERLGTAGRSGGSQNVGIGSFGSVEQLDEKFAPHGGHVACQHQIPIFSSVGERGKDAAQRPFAGIAIGEHGMAEETIALRIAYQSHVTGRAGNRIGDISGERYAPERQQGFILAHARAAASDQHVSGAAHTNPGHSKMITSWIRWPGGRRIHLAWHRRQTLL